MPRILDLGPVCLHHYHQLAQGAKIEASAACQRDVRFQPEFALSAFAPHMNVDRLAPASFEQKKMRKSPSRNTTGIS